MTVAMVKLLFNSLTAGNHQQNLTHEGELLLPEGGWEEMK